MAPTWSSSAISTDAGDLDSEEDDTSICEEDETSMCFGCTPAEAANYVQVVLTHHHPRLRKALSQHNPRMVACAHMEPPWKCRKIMHEPIGLGPVDDLYRGCDGHPCTVSKIISNIIHCKAYLDTETNKLQTLTKN